jgi:glycosyltransferase involved in cell wall biosynthesis
MTSPLNPANASLRTDRHKLRLAYFVSHPIQYQAPLLRRIAQEEDIDMTVFFSSDMSVRTQGFSDPGFGVSVKWDVPLLEGYKHEFLPVLRNSDRLGPFSPLNRGIARAIRRGRFDAVWVHGYSSLAMLQAIHAASAQQIPVLLRGETTLYDHKRSRMRLAAKSLFFAVLRRQVSALLAIGESNTAYWRHYFGEDFPIFPFHYCVDNEFFQRQCEAASKCREQFRSSLGLEAGRPVILYASKLTSRKRCADLLEAFLKLSNSGRAGPAPYLLIVGDGEERAALEIRAKQAGRDDVRFFGFRNQSELPRFYNLCDVFVLASVDEPWGLVVNEAMNAGRAVIVSDQVGCQKDLVHDGVNGSVVKARDVDGLAQSLQAVLANEETWQQMGAQSLRIVQEYSFDRNVTGLRRALQALVPSFHAAVNS